MRTSVYAALKDDIIACRLMPGTELREPEIAARYSVGRSPLREALLRLEAEGLVVIVPRQYCRVAPISLRDAADMFGLRRVLEPEAARLVARTADDAARTRLLAVAAGDEAADFIDDNRRFHCTLASLAPNRRLGASCIEIIEQSDRLVRVSLAQIEGRRPALLIGEHRVIADAVVRGDARTAARLLRAHIDAAETRVLSALRRAAVID
ncbi:GntR family transcriptional regulator [Acidiphilium acidophilum]|uniref:GntR family transcriptional regulator n=1 Tax=Acidiphilium acidophilum TaxID=76588 RepID=A0AAW9DXM9_ACIAO|nr:GntR family transcriptional regulator [Acidiphilium acidophilum]MDX5933018.1 GntR family transcriptional regulator [Acidiphilium acidophilum]